MTVTLLPAIYLIDIPMIRQRVPEPTRAQVLDAILQAMYTLPTDPSQRTPLLRDLQGLYKCRFSSGLQPGAEDMRLAVFADEDADAMIIWAIGFRDAYLPTDFYRLLRLRLQSERNLGTSGAFRIGRRRLAPPEALRRPAGDACMAISVAIA